MTDEQLQEAVAAMAEHGSQVKAAAVLGIARSTLQQRLMRAASVGLLGGPPVPAIARPAPGFAITRNSGTYDADGNLLRQSVQSRPDAGPVFEMPAAFKIGKATVQLGPDKRVEREWIKLREDAISRGLVEALQEAFAKFEGAAPVGPAPLWQDGELHTIYPLADLHLGMYSWGRETGEAYDMEIAIQRARSAYRSLIASSQPSKTATLLNTGDFLHANDQKNVTPGSGHQLDVDGRFPRVLQAGADLLIEVIDLLLQKHDEVEVVMLAGNHDPEAAIALRIALNLFYRKHPRVKVHMAPGIAWYRRFGKNLFGATHGHTIKQGELAGMMANDRKEDWGVTDFRAFFTGHIHHERALEKAGVRAESFQTLASRDAYATNGGWRSGHSVQAITYHCDEGELSRSRVNVLVQPHRQKAAA